MAKTKKTMQAAILRAHGQELRIERLPVPEPGPGEILIKVEACGVCHSDVHAVDGDWEPKPVLPLIPGHEVVGRVVGLGANVGDIKTGDPVGVPWMWSACGSCEYCLSGQETICPTGEATGYSKPGGFAEYVVAPAAYVGRLPETYDAISLAPILCAGVTVYRGIKRTEGRPGQWLFVYGVGGLGHLAVQYARVMGFRVAAIDIAADKLALAKKLGAEICVDAREKDAGRALVKQTGGGAHAALVTTPALKAYDQAFRALRRGGSLSFIGIPSHAEDGFTASISRMSGRELTLRGSSVGSRLDMAEAIR
jgi:alcohol dehydrogenase, propanol-preferring